ncbi:hypothetical protein Pcac1_g20937 [Phytophthora cactorum]|nr:hypothetical protein Pcac1_g20937 [Phytophthora cactorum]
MASPWIADGSSASARREYPFQGGDGSIVDGVAGGANGCELEAANFKVNGTDRVAGCQINGAELTDILLRACQWRAFGAKLRYQTRSDSKTFFAGGFNRAGAVRRHNYTEIEAVEVSMEP